MPKSQGDGLLVAARILVVLITVVLIVSLVAVCIGIGALLTVGQESFGTASCAPTRRPSPSGS